MPMTEAVMPDLPSALYLMIHIPLFPIDADFPQTLNRVRL